MRALVLVPALAGALALAACSTNVTDIHAESTGASGAGGHTTLGAGGGSTASAAGSGGSGAGSCCLEPVHVAGQVKTLSADTDAAQLVTKQHTMTAKLLEGPLVLTDFFGDNVYFAVASSCTSNGMVPVGGGHGVHLYVPPGAALCHTPGNQVVISGYRPY